MKFRQKIGNFVTIELQKSHMISFEHLLLKVMNELQPNNIPIYLVILTN